jgi:threonine dehydrogenase-like Zn-dependent dehydrogenase
LEAHGASLDSITDQVKHSVGLETDLGHVLREAIQACRKGGTVSVPGVYAGFIDKFPIGAAFGKGLQIRLGQTHVQKYMRPLLEQIQTGAIDPTFIITHRIPLEDAAKAYQIFRYKQDGCIKVILKP